jgi:hypothetical protein
MYIYLQRTEESVRVRYLKTMLEQCYKSDASIGKEFSRDFTRTKSEGIHPDEVVENRPR